MRNLGSAISFPFWNFPFAKDRAERRLFGLPLGRNSLRLTPLDGPVKRDRCSILLNVV